MNKLDRSLLNWGGGLIVLFMVIAIATYFKEQSDLAAIPDIVQRKQMAEQASAYKLITLLGQIVVTPILAGAGAYFGNKGSRRG